MVENTDQAAGMTRLGTLTGIASRDEQLIEVNDHLWVSKDISDSILVTTPEGNVVINSGMPGNGETHRQRFREVSEQPVEYLVITQCHGDHFGGVHEIRDPETRVITQEKFEECREYWRILDDFYKRRSGKLWGSVLGKRADVKNIIREVTPDITFRDDYMLELGGRQFELYAVSGGESEDGVIVWLPQEKLVISGDMAFHQRMLPLFEHTDTAAWIATWDKFADLGAEVVIPGHGGPTTMDVVTLYTKDYLVHLRKEVAAVIDEGGSMLEAYEIDQSDFMHLPTAEFLSKRNAGQVFQMMEFE